MSLKLMQEVVVEQLVALINRYDVDMLSYQEHGLTFGYFKLSETSDTFLR